MNNLYDILNISGNKEEKIKSCIDKVRIKLKDLTEEQTCKIYSSYLSDELNDNHVVNKIIRTGDFSSYDHHFILIPKDSDNYYLIDLTYSQFNNDHFKELLDDGYIIVNKADLIIYLSIVTGQVIDKEIDDIYFAGEKNNEDVFNKGM